MRGGWSTSGGKDQRALAAHLIAETFGEQLEETFTDAGDCILFLTQCLIVNCLGIHLLLLFFFFSRLTHLLAG